MADVLKISECPDCASTNIVHGLMRDQVICRDCGLIFEEPAPVPVFKPAKVAAHKPKRVVKPKKKAKGIKKKRRVKKRGAKKKVKKKR